MVRGRVLRAHHEAGQALVQHRVNDVLDDAQDVEARQDGIRQLHVVRYVAAQVEILSKLRKLFVII